MRRGGEQFVLYHTMGMPGDNVYAHTVYLYYSMQQERPA